jgi:hypothetical protein
VIRKLTLCIGAKRCSLLILFKVDSSRCVVLHSEPIINRQTKLYIFYIILIFSYMFRLTLNPSSCCIHKIKDKSLTIVILKYIKIYSSRDLELVTSIHVFLYRNCNRHNIQALSRLEVAGYKDEIYNKIHIHKTMVILSPKLYWVCNNVWSGQCISGRPLDKGLRSRRFKTIWSV